jgi:AcrR family transcriptional regulator
MWNMSKKLVRDLPGPREQLLERVIDHLCEHGIGDTSLRSLAAALGTSHRMLIYHFGSKEELLVEVSIAMEERQRRILGEILGSPGASLADSAREFWVRLRSPELAAAERLFFELYSHGLQGRPHARKFMDGVVETWVDATAPALEAAGLSHSDSRSEARLGLAVVRGLLLDVLATGDVEAADRAFDRHLEAMTSLIGR